MAIEIGFSHIVRNICETYYPKNIERNVDIITHRFGLDNQPVKTLEDIGDKYGLTRERIRQIEESILKILSSLIRYGRYVKRYKLREKSIYLTDDEKKKISDVVWSILDSGMMFFDNSLIQSNYISSEFNLIMECIDYKRLSLSCSDFEVEAAWVKSDDLNNIEKYLNALSEVIKEKNKVQYFDFVVFCNKKGFTFNDELFDFLMKRLVKGVTISICDDVKYLVKDVNRLSTVDKIERLLDENGPQSINEIFRKINKGNNKIITLENIRNQMVSDQRFSPIGKSGVWQLAKNGKLKNISILDSICRVLSESGEPMKANDILNGVKSIRGDTFAIKSINSYLYSRKDLFVLLDDGRFALSDWIGKRSLFKEKERVEQKSLGNIYELLLDFMSIDEEKPLAEIVTYFKKRGFKDISIRNRLERLVKKGVFLDITPEGKRNRVLKLVNSNTSTETKLTLTEQVHRAIISELSKHPNKKVTKGELYLTVLKRLPKLTKATFYAYCSSLEDKRIISLKEGNNIYLVYSEI